MCSETPDTSPMCNVWMNQYFLIRQNIYYKFEFATFKTIMTIPYPHERANIHHALFLLVSNLFEKKMLGA